MNDPPSRDACDLCRGEDGKHAPTCAEGMKLRDGFACAAMSALLGNEQGLQGLCMGGAHGLATGCARLAYSIADAMLVARGRR